MSIELASCKSTLYSIAKLLNDIGSCYLNEGVYWIASILKNNSSLIDGELDQDTIYYIDKYIKRYMYENRQLVKQSKELKDEVLVILDFLVYRGEVSGYLLRESIV